MTQIELITNDQKLTISGRPVIASGDKNTVQIKVRFDSAWEGFAKSATFFTEADRDKIFEIVLSDDMCIVPHEVLADPGIIHIGVRGIKADTDATKTSDLVSYRIKQGASEGTDISTPPTPSMYQQLLDKVAKLDDEAVKSVNGQKPDANGNVSVSGGGGGSTEGAVLYTPQDLTEEQKAQARDNIGSVGAEEFNALKSDIETALDNIISIQNKLIGGESV